jgi:hypothetical protein
VPTGAERRTRRSTIPADCDLCDGVTDPTATDYQAFMESLEPIAKE